MKMFAVIEKTSLQCFGYYFAEAPIANAVMSEDKHLEHCEVIGGEWIDAPFEIIEDENDYHTLVFVSQ